MVEVARDQGTGSGSAGWDPYQVWAERVRQEFPKRGPREKNSQRALQSRWPASLIQESPRIRPIEPADSN
jgi:hypothetical protein